MPRRGLGHSPATPAGAKPVEILVVDDNPADRLACRRALQRAEWTVAEADSAEAALAALDERTFHVVLSDYNLKSAKDGIDVLAHALHAHPAARRILMSGFFTPGVVERARERARIHAHLDKPDILQEWAKELARVLAVE